MIGYKVLRFGTVAIEPTPPGAWGPETPTTVLDFRKLVSATTDNNHDITYENPGPTKPPAGWGPLALFETFEMAQGFWEEFGHTIWQVEYEPHVFPKEDFDEDSWRLWCYSRHLPMSFSKGQLPHGTVFASSITLLKRVLIKSNLRERANAVI